MELSVIDAASAFPWEDLYFFSKHRVRKRAKLRFTLRSVSLAFACSLLIITENFVVAFP